jgi:Phytanoyl-CoA dioxygenase (PhyH)
MDMDKRFGEMAAKYYLPEDIARQLRDDGYVVIEAAVADARCAQLSEAYDTAVRAARPDDVSIGRTSVRVHDLVNCGPEFDGLYLYGPLLAACCSIIRQPFKLSTMLARTVKPYSSAQALHVDFRSQDGWPMVGFIIMVDDFRADNGATRFVPGSHFSPHAPTDVMQDATADYEGQVLATGRAGSIIIYNGSIWHGHTANRSAEPRRSIQGAFIRREAQSALNQAARIRPETLARIGDLTKYLLDLDPNGCQSA